MKDPLNQTKLIVMYVLHLVSLPMIRVQLFDYILEKKYSTFFQMQKTLEELVAADMVELRADSSNTYLALTATGMETIEMLYDRLPEEMRDDISVDVENLSPEEDEEDDVAEASIHKNEKGDISVCLVLEDEGVKQMELWIKAKDDRMARRLCDGLKKRSQEIYSYLIGEE